jgi:hypothetical protein
MEVILQVISQLKLVLIAVCGICCAAFVFVGLSSLRDLRRAVFRLERSAVAARAMSAWLRAGLFALLAAAVWVIGNLTPSAAESPIADSLLITPTGPPDIPAPTSLPTADLSEASVTLTGVPSITVEFAATPAPADATTAAATAVPAAVAAVNALTPATAPANTVSTRAPPTAANVNPTSQPSETATPGPDAAAQTEPLAADCPNPDAQISNPVAGETLAGAYDVRGTAGVPLGGRYKVEILRPNIAGWAFLWESSADVKNGVLMPNFNTGLFPPGTYWLRLVIVNAAGGDNLTCRVPIKIAG